jgi:hypothetical protein
VGTELVRLLSSRGEKVHALINSSRRAIFLQKNLIDAAAQTGV